MDEYAALGITAVIGMAVSLLIGIVLGTQRRIDAGKAQVVVTKDNRIGLWFDMVDDEGKIARIEIMMTHAASRRVASSILEEERPSE